MRVRPSAGQLFSVRRRAKELVFPLREHRQEVFQGQVLEPWLVALEEELAEPELPQAPLAAEREDAPPVRADDHEVLPGFRIEGDLDTRILSRRVELDVDARLLEGHITAFVVLLLTTPL